MKSPRTKLDVFVTSVDAVETEVADDTCVDALTAHTPELVVSTTLQHCKSFAYKERTGIYTYGISCLHTAISLVRSIHTVRSKIAANRQRHAVAV